MEIKRLAGTAWGVWDGEKGVVIDTAKRSQRDKLFREIEKNRNEGRLYTSYTHAL